MTTNYEAILPANIDSTMMSAFKSCPRKFYHEFILGLRPPAVSIHLHAGGCYASALEHFYNAVHVDRRPTDLALAEALLVLGLEWGDYEISEHDKDTAKTPIGMGAALIDYVETYPPLTDTVQPYFTEEGRPTFEYSFAIPLDFPGWPKHPVSGDPYIYSGRFDMLGRWNNLPIVKDDKTTKSASYRWAEDWQLRSQFMGYCWACQQAGIPVNNVCIRGTVILKTEIRQIQALKTYDQLIIDRWFEQLRRDLWRLTYAWEEGYFDYNFNDACTSFGGCYFPTLCKSPHPERWFHEYAVRRWNPLDRNPDEEKKDA
jgi:hypothetical protein